MKTILFVLPAVFFIYLLVCTVLFTIFEVKEYKERKREEKSPKSCYYGNDAWFEDLNANRY